MNNKKKPTVLIAFGGNALIQKGQAGTASEQIENLALPMKQVAQLSKDYTLIITHGNGPQVGNLLLQQESCDDVPKMPLEIIGAMTQGQIGYMIESSLDSALMEIGINGEQLFVTVITYVVVDENDPAFQNPTKPIGPFYTEEEASKLPYTMTKTDKGYRRVVASPRPLAIVERREIKKLIALDFIVICCGGGGIPVIDINVYNGKGNAPAGKVSMAKIVFFKSMPPRLFEKFKIPGVVDMAEHIEMVSPYRYFYSALHGNLLDRHIFRHNQKCR